jgi:acylphosphatase
VIVRHYLVKGRVQGVGFRWYVLQQAAELGLRGWVRNTSDGDVEVTAAGDENQITALESSLRRGSRGSRVDRILAEDRAEAESETLRAFEIEGAW